MIEEMKFGAERYKRQETRQNRLYLRNISRKSQYNAEISQSREINGDNLSLSSVGLGLFGLNSNNQKMFPKTQRSTLRSEKQMEKRATKSDSEVDSEECRELGPHQDMSDLNLSKSVAYYEIPSISNCSNDLESQVQAGPHFQLNESQLQHQKPSIPTFPLEETKSYINQDIVKDLRGKNGNLPKFIFRIIAKHYPHFISQQQDFPEQLRLSLISSIEILNKLSQLKQSSITVNQLSQYFVDESGEEGDLLNKPNVPQEMRRRLRVMLRNKIGTCLNKEIMQNNQVKRKASHYLSCKVLQLRCSCARLMSRLEYK